MKRYSAVLIDDEKKLREVLRLKLDKHCPMLDLVGEAENADKGCELISQHNPQIVFLDIAMPKESGLEMLKRLDTFDFEVIFVTGYSDFALEALRISAVDYLLKPVINEDLVNAVAKAIHRIEQRNLVKGYELLQHNIAHTGQQLSRISIPGTHSYEVAEIKEIVRCEGEQKYTRIFLKDGRNLLSSYNIGVFREMLESFQFYSTHKSHLINIHHILRYRTDGTVVMSDLSEVPVSRRKKEDFKERVLMLSGQLNQGNGN